VAVIVGAPAQTQPVLNITGFTIEEGSSGAFVLKLSEATTVDVTGTFTATQMTAT
jgi:hypothetical protein